MLAHLADAEMVTAWRVRSILASNGTPLQAFDQDAWAEAFKYGEVDPAESLRTFTAARASLLSLLARVDPSRHTHHGLHAERGEETIAHLIQLYAGHDINHLKQIEALVGSGADFSLRRQLRSSLRRPEQFGRCRHSSAANPGKNANVHDAKFLR